MSKGKTVIEKIIGLHSDEDAVQGRIVWVNLDVVSARDFGGANVVQNFDESFPGETVNNKTKTIFTFDCNVPANTIGYADNQHKCRLFARKHGLSVFDVDAGIGSHVMIEKGLALPGSIIVGTDSHLNLLGAVGCFGQGMGDIDIAYSFKNTRTWFEIPQSVSIELSGKLRCEVTAKDVTLFLVGKLGASGLLGLCAEIHGEVIDRMDMAERITLASMGTEMGAISLFVKPNEHLICEIESMSGKTIDRSILDRISPDSDADYLNKLEFDLSELQPLIACPPKPDHVETVAKIEMERIPVDSVVVGSCTGGRERDIKDFARIISQHGLAPGVMAKVAPATRAVYMNLLNDGTLKELANAGIMIINQGCAGCAAGQIGMTGSGEVQVTTGNRNFAGKQGKGNTYLASAKTAGFCAARGYICAK